MDKKERYLQWGYCEYKDTETDMVKGNYVQVMNEQVDKIADLEAKLAEKEKEIKELKKEIRDELVDNNMAILELQQSQNQTAIAELEKVKVKLNEEINNANVLLDPIEYEDYHELLGVIRGYKLSVDQIDQQIKELKGGK